MKLLNFARGNSGTLIQYAALKEYAQKYNPTIVLWFYYVNDIYDLEKWDNFESKHPNIFANMYTFWYQKVVWILICFAKYKE